LAWRKNGSLPIMASKGVPTSATSRTRDGVSSISRLPTAICRTARLVEDRGRSTVRPRTARDILAERQALGEVDPDEYEEHLSHLS